MEYTPSCARPDTPEKSSAANPAMEVSTPSRTVGQNPDTQSPSLRRIALDEEVDRIVDRLADEGRAEAERDAVHHAESQRHGGHAAIAPESTGSMPRPRASGDR
jgi:hypothetical protein